MIIDFREESCDYDNRDPDITEVRPHGKPDVVVDVHIPFALALVENALENMGHGTEMFKWQFQYIRELLKK